MHGVHAALDTLLDVNPTWQLQVTVSEVLSDEQVWEYSELTPHTVHCEHAVEAEVAEYVFEGQD